MSQMYDRVMIYEDPISELKLEGKALLVHKLSSENGNGLERWEVRFEGESEVFERFIKVS